MLVKNIVATLERHGLERQNDPFGREWRYEYRSAKGKRLYFEAGDSGHARNVYLHDTHYGNAGQAVYDFVTSSALRTDYVQVEDKEVRVVRGLWKKTYSPWVVASVNERQGHCLELPHHTADMPTEVLIDWMQDQELLVL